MKDGSYIVTTNNYEFELFELCSNCDFQELSARAVSARELNIYKYGNDYSISFGDPTNKEGACVGLTYDITNPKIIKLDLGFAFACLLLSSKGGETP